MSLGEQKHGERGRSLPDYNRVSIQPQSGAGKAGYVHIVLANGKCLEANWGYDNPGSPPDWLRDNMEQPCSDRAEQLWRFIPVDKNPGQSGSDDPNALRFYIQNVNDIHQRCLFSNRNGLSGDGNYEAWDVYHGWGLPERRGLAPCGSTSYQRPHSDRIVSTGEYMMFEIINDERYTTGQWRQWSNVLDLAIAGSATWCDAHDAGACRIRTPSSGNQWASPLDPGVLASGQLVTRAAGCGTPFNQGTTAKYYNDSPSTVNVAVSSSVTTTHQTTRSMTDKFSVEISAEYGSKDVWKMGTKWSYAHDGTTTYVDSQSQTNQSAFTIPVPSHMHYMWTWTEQAYVLSGDWLFDTNLPNGAGNWQLAVTTAFPAGTNSEVAAHGASHATRSEKSCFAGPASTNTSDPFLVADPSQCTSGTPVKPTPAVGVTVHACPGTWTIPGATGGGTNEPVYAYQWYFEDTSGKITDIDHATGASYTLHAESLIHAHAFLGVKVTEVGDQYRFESEPAQTHDPLPLQPSGDAADASGDVADASGDVAALAEPPAATTFAGFLHDAVLGSSYTGRVVAAADLDGTPAAGAGMRLSADGLPAGLTLNPDGTLSGTPTEAGVFTVTVSDEGEVPSSRQLTLTVLDPAPRAQFAPTSQFDLTAGVATSLPLFQQPGTADIRLAGGRVPPGLGIDPETGVLSGTPAYRGQWMASVEDGASNPTFTFAVNDRFTTFRSGALPTAVVGASYSQPLVDELGTGSVIGLVLGDGTVGDAFDGLFIDGNTGVLSGVPTTPGTVAFVVSDVTEPDHPVQTFTLRVSSGLAATGADESVLRASLAISTLLIGLGAVLLVIRARRRTA